MTINLKGTRTGWKSIQDVLHRSHQLSPQRLHSADARAPNLVNSECLIHCRYCLLSYTGDLLLLTKVCSCFWQAASVGILPSNGRTLSQCSTSFVEYSSGRGTYFSLETLAMLMH